MKIKIYDSEINTYYKMIGNFIEELSSDLSKNSIENNGEHYYDAEVKIMQQYSKRLKSISTMFDNDFLPKK